MKKVMVLILCVAMVLTFAACASTTTTTTAAGTTTTATGTTSGTTTTTGTNFAGKTITLGTWGGSFKEAMVGAYVKPFEAATGAKVIVEEYAGDVLAKVKTQVEQKLPGYDIVSGIGAIDFVPYLAKAGALQAIDYAKLPNTENINEGGKFEYGIGGYICATNVMYLAESFPNGGPTNAQEYYDVAKFPGSRALISFSPTGVLEQALVADGVAKEDLYPLDVDRAFKKLDTIKSSVTKWWGSGAEIFQALNDGEVDMGIFWIAHGMRAKKAGVDVKISHQDASLLADAWAIPSNATNLDVVYAFLNFANDPQQVAIFSRMLGYAPLIPEAMEYLTDDEIANMTCNPENEKQGIWIDVEYWSENYEKLTERYMEWIAG